MLFSGKKNSGAKGISSSLWIIAGVALVIFSGSSYIRVVMQKLEIQGEIDRLKAEKEKYEANNSDLAGLLDFFASESYKEREMRLKLNMQKPGEKVVIISRPEGNTTRDSAAKNEENSSAFSNVKKWKEYFFGK